MPRHIREVKRDGASSKEERWRERKGERGGGEREGGVREGGKRGRRKGK